jgi:threonyl-tRNA synthetase
MNEQLDHLRHSCAHLLAAAVLELYPNTKRTIGPAIETGFYYDFDFGDIKISDADLSKIEEKMKEIAPTWKEFSRREVSESEARKAFENNEYKNELIDEFSKDGQTLTLYTSGNYVDLCRGGHSESPSKELKFFKLISVAGAYWRGDEKNKMLTRIYGTCFKTKEELVAYLTQIEEAKKRDHKKLGVDLDLFTFSELVGSGLPLWTPRGTLVRNLLDQYVWSLREARGYEKVEIPHITKKELYVTSGHWDKYKDDLFRIVTREGHEFAMKPMNCPHHTQIYNRKQWSYRNLPQRYANTTVCYRDEQSGELSGLSRVRAFAQDDAHVFCRMSQAKEEFLKIWDIIHAFYGTFGFVLRVRISKHDPAHPEKYLGEPDRWAFAEKMLEDIAAEKKAEAFLGLGEAAFYGPKLDFMAKDAIGREWQVATIQLDLNMPERFDLTCISEDGAHERIVMIHAAIMGSIERFLSILIEHTAGSFPTWLSPVQVMFLPVSAKHVEIADSIAAEFKNLGIRIGIDPSDETVGKKIRNAAGQKIPYIVVVGDKEAAGENWQIKVRGQQDPMMISKQDFINKILKEIKDRV